MTRRYFVISILLLATPLVAGAAFSGPSESPPNGNVPGVIWNIPTAGGQASEQTGTEMNIDGSGRFGGDIILGDTKALRIDSLGAAEFNIGNWGNGVQPLTVHVYGDLIAEPADASEGSISAPKFCLAGDCIDAWPIGGVGGDVTSLLAGSGISLDAAIGDVTVSFDDGYGDARYVLKDGDTMNGPLILSADPVDPLEAAPMQYVDAIALQKLDLAGGVMTGALELAADPTGALEAATKQYVDAGDGMKLDLLGGTMMGPLILAADPADPMEAATRQYVDASGQYANGAFLRKDGVSDTAQGRISFAQGLAVTGSDLSQVGLSVGGVGLDTGISVSSDVRGVVSTANSYPFMTGGTPLYGMYVAQSTNGAYFRGSSKGVWAKSVNQAGYFENELAGGSAYAILGGTTAPAEFYAPGGTALYVVGTTTMTKNATVGTDLFVGGNVLANGKLTVSGDIVAAVNTLSSCAWTAYIADGAILQCPLGTPIMSGMQRGVGTTRIYCCQL